MDFGLAKRRRGSAVARRRHSRWGRSTDGPRRHRRHARLHVAGASERRAARRAIRPVLLRRDAGGDDGRAASVPQAVHDGNLFRRAPRTAGARRRYPSGGDGPAAAAARQGRRGSLRVHRGRARRSGTAGRIVRAVGGQTPAPARRSRGDGRPWALSRSCWSAAAAYLLARSGCSAPGLARAGGGGRRRCHSIDCRPSARQLLGRSRPRTISPKG